MNNTCRVQVPSSHREQEAWPPGCKLSRPGGQSKHIVAPSDAEYLPAIQLTQVPGGLEAPSVPVGQDTIDNRRAKPCQYTTMVNRQM